MNYITFVKSYLPTSGPNISKPKPLKNNTIPIADGNRLIVKTLGTTKFQ